MAVDYYKTIGVAETASEDEIKKVYRKLAKKYHPDRNKGNKQAEAKFKEISEAYSTLSDKKKRQEYDDLRKYGGMAGFGAHAGGPQGFDPSGFDFARFSQGRGSRGGRGGRTTFTFDNAGGGGMGGLEDILASVLGGGGFGSGGGAQHRGQGGDPFGQFQHAGQAPPKGADVTASVNITFMESVKGVEKILTGAGQKIKVKIPAGIDNGGKIRLRGQGQPGPMGTQKGDLIITVRVMPDKQFERKGNDIYSTVEISFVEAIKGCKVNIKTLVKTVALTIPPGTQPSTQMRLKGMGLSVGGKQGDHYARINITIPQTLTDKQKKLLDEWEG